MHDLRSKIGVIPQDPIFFKGTVRSNLDPFDAHNDTDIWTALDQVGIKDFISEQPAKLLAPLEDGGTNLSQGYRQLLCIARAFLVKPKILIMDEATSSLDVATDQKVQQIIQEVFKSNTVISISHRLASIAECDRILVISSGSIIGALLMFHLNSSLLLLFLHLLLLHLFSYPQRPAHPMLWRATQRVSSRRSLTRQARRRRTSCGGG